MVLIADALEGRWIFAGYAWKEERIELELHALDSARTDRLSAFPELSFKVTEDRRCSGWIDFEKLRRVPCEERVAVTSGLQCQRCTQREGFAGCIRCTGVDCPDLPAAVRAYCTSEHHLYLATFGGSAVKVGTASAVRKKARLQEQGALAAIYVASAPGPEIKQLEASVSELGYTTAMRRSEKLGLLGSGTSEEEAVALLLSALEDLAARLPHSMRGYLHDPVPLRQPEQARRARSFQYLQSLPLRAGETIAGRALGATGSLVVIDDGAGPAALDVAALRCRVIERQPASARSDVSRQLPLLQ